MMEYPVVGTQRSQRAGTLTKYISISFQIEWDMIVVIVFFSILNQMEFHLVQNRKDNYYHDHIPFNVKENRILVYSVQKGSLYLKHMN